MTSRPPHLPPIKPPPSLATSLATLLKSSILEAWSLVFPTLTHYHRRPRPLSGARVVKFHSLIPQLAGGAGCGPSTSRKAVHQAIKQAMRESTSRKAMAANGQWDWRTNIWSPLTSASTYVQQAHTQTTECYWDNCIPHVHTSSPYASRMDTYVQQAHIQQAHMQTAQ
jgi:hypothetical protein